jgi:hypothetical protein
MTVTALNLNITEEAYANAGNSAPVDEDHYEVSIYSIDFDTVKAAGPNKGKPRLKFQFKIVEGETTGSKNANRKIYHDVNAFDGTNKEGKPIPPFELIDIAKAIGITREGINAFNKGDWLGQNLRLSVSHRQKMTKESGYKEPVKPAEFMAEAKRFRSLDSAAASAAANAGTGTSKKSKYAL